MKIRVKDIPPAGLDTAQRLALGEMGLSDAEFGLTGPVDITAHVERIVNAITVTVRVAALSNAQCSRCLKPVNAERRGTFTFNYTAEKGVEYIDVGEDIRQEMILGRPEKVLCRPDCKGMCSGCGVDLNNEACACAPGTASEAAD